MSVLIVKMQEGGIVNCHEILSVKGMTQRAYLIILLFFRSLSKIIFRDFSMVVERLKQQLVTTEMFKFYVRREYVLEDALKRTLKPTFSVNNELIVSVHFQECMLTIICYTLQVYFIGEQGYDNGGLSREFSTYYLKKCFQNIWNQQEHSDTMLWHFG